MATSYITPGVYIEEVGAHSTSVKPVETSVPVFIGYTQKRGTEDEQLPVTSTMEDGAEIEITRPFKIRSVAEYELYFGKAEPTPLSAEIIWPGARDEGMPQINIAIEEQPVYTLYYHLQLYFVNGGRDCYIISVGNTRENNISAARLLKGVRLVKECNEATLIIIPEAVNIDTTDTGAVYSLYDEALLLASETKKFVLLDCHNNDPSSLKNYDAFDAKSLSFGAAYHPFLHSLVNLNYSVNTVNVSGNGVVRAEMFENLEVHLQELVIAEIKNVNLILPPCSCVAGAYVTTDYTYGVWKAPANIGLKSIAAVTKQLTDQDQDNLYASAGATINPIRPFTGRGILVWGARTLAGSDNELRYVSVRRFFNMVEESCSRSTDVLIFEANEALTWSNVKAMIENFLVNLWRQGALQGNRPGDAFYVAVGLGSTMTAVDILEGRMIIEIGMAVVRPAEFVVIRITKNMPVADV